MLRFVYAFLAKFVRLKIIVNLNTNYNWGCSKIDLLMFQNRRKYTLHDYLR